MSPQATELKQRNSSLTESPELWRRHSSAWVISMVFHVAALVVIGLLIRPTPQGAAEEPDRTAGIVLARPTADRVEYFDESSQSAAAAASASADTVLANAQPQLPSIDGLLPALPDAGGRPTTQSGALADATSLLEGSGSDGQIGQPTTTRVFGVEGTGTRFVYVFDRSASMEGFGGRPMLEAKRELIQSLNSLKRTNQFQIVFYNEQPMAFNPNPAAGPELLFGTDKNKEEAQGFIAAIRGRGGTRHLDALQLALRMGPDVVFFLTDADEPQLTREELDDVDRWNKSEATIHTIEFGVGDQKAGRNFLQEIARRNQGQHVYRDVSTFDDP